ncbi:flagellin protein FlaA [Sandaracinobacter sp. RS1-74]|uniref:flagellin N-terminal helical domain-containing protein n=1 Tax=Sandaracinobacteroides sayramensis TaxID=2913411 RepID=UPI001EDBB3D5|nr:flagellin [Sandaracinobacteroides sayramensis]MCG2840071.1 flagellin protein FlaA [Sandaracinobacteroides sayramensis]
MTIINTNLSALRAQSGSRIAQAGLDTAMERLSTGLRINSAKDDAAGLAIAQRMTADVRGLSVAIRNAGDGISLAQTAETAMGEVANMLQRMRELAMRASTGTMSTEAREALQAEVTQLIGEVDNVANRTDFNGVKLLDGSSKALSLQTGARAGQTVQLTIGSARAGDLGTGSVPGLTATGAFETSAANLVANQALQANDLRINGVTIGSSRNTDDSVSSVAKEASAIAKAAAINRVSDQTGVRAVVGATTMTGTAMTAAALTGTVTINGVTTGSITTSANAAASRTAVVDAINLISGQTGVRAIDTGDSNLGIRLEAADGRNIEVSLDTLTAGATGLKVGAQSGSYSLVSESGGPILVDSVGSGRLSRAGLAAGSFERGVSTVSTDARAVASAANGSDARVLNTGDLVINGVSIRASKAADDTYSDTTAGSSNKAASAIAVAAAINESSAQTGVTATARALTIDGTTTTVIAADATATLVINGVSMDIALKASDSAQQTRENVASVINNFAGATGVTASDNGRGGLSLTAADGRNVAVWFDSDEAASAANFGLGAATIAGTGTAYTVTGVTDPADVSAATVNTAYAQVTLNSSKAIDVRAGSQGFAAGSNFANLGFEENRYGADVGGLKVKDIDISSQEGAQAALSALDEALQAIAVNRAELGAVQNRLEATINNLSSASTNTMASRSRIQDADFAEETTNLARGQILTQAAQAMLAQANQSQQGVLQLLR